MQKTSVWCGGGRGRALAAAALLTALVVTGCYLLNKEEESAEDVKITLLGVTADGSQGGPGTTALTLTFDQKVAALAAGDISWSESGATPGALSGEGPVYTLAISGVSANTTLCETKSRKLSSRNSRKLLNNNFYNNFLHCFSNAFF